MQVRALQNPDVETRKAPAYETWFIPIQHCSKGLSFREAKSHLFHGWFQRWTGRIHVRDWISPGWLSCGNLSHRRDSQRLTLLSFGHGHCHTPLPKLNPIPPTPPHPTPTPLPGHFSCKCVLDSGCLSPSDLFHSTGSCYLPKDLSNSILSLHAYLNSIFKKTITIFLPPFSLLLKSVTLPQM